MCFTDKELEKFRWRQKKSSYEKSFFLTFNLKQTTLFFVVSFVLAHELVNASSGVNQFQLAGEERVRSVRDFELHNGILFTIGVDNGFFGAGAALGENHVVVRHVFKHHEAVVFGMNSFFHFLFVCRLIRLLLDDCL